MTATIPIGGLIQALNNIRSKCDEAVGAAAALELRLRIIAEWEPRVQVALKGALYHEANLSFLIRAVLEIFQNELSQEEKEEIKSCVVPRNKVSHGSFVEFMIKLNGEALGREIDPKTRKGKPIEKSNIVDGALSIEGSVSLEKYSRRVNKTIKILDDKILRSLEK